MSHSIQMAVLGKISYNISRSLHIFAQIFTQTTAVWGNVLTPNDNLACERWHLQFNIEKETNKSLNSFYQNYHPKKMSNTLTLTCFFLLKSYVDIFFFFSLQGWVQTTKITMYFLRLVTSNYAVSKLLLYFPEYFPIYIYDFSHASLYSTVAWWLFRDTTPHSGMLMWWEW